MCAYSISYSRSPSEIKNDLESLKTFYNKNVDKIKDKDRVKRESLNSEKVAIEMARDISILRDLVKVCSLSPYVENFHVLKNIIFIFFFVLHCVYSY